MPAEEEKKSSSIWSLWTPVIYKFPWGYSVTRGCTFAWFFLMIPYYCFLYCRRVACNFVYALFSHPKHDSCMAYVAMYVSWVPTIILAIIWIIVTIILFIPWLLFYILGMLCECIIMIIYGVSCAYYCCGSHEKVNTEWRTFSCSGWITDWSSGYDPFTKEIWDEWSPVRTLCDYNFPPV